MLTISHLTKTFGGKTAVDDLSLHIAPGEICGFIGHNGAGKTTTIKACCGILTPDSGSIEIAGTSVAQDPIACKKSLAYIPDNPDLYEFLSGIQYLNFVADIYGVSQADRQRRIHQYAALFDLTDDLAQPVSGYSHGMKQKLATIVPSLWSRTRLPIFRTPTGPITPRSARVSRGCCWRLWALWRRFLSCWQMDLISRCRFWTRRCLFLPARP